MKNLPLFLLYSVYFIFNTEINAQVIQGKFKFYYNYPPDSIYINNRLIQLNDNNNYPIDYTGDFKIRAVLNEWGEVTKTVSIAQKRKIQQVRIYFPAKTNLSEEKLDSLKRFLPLKSVFSKYSLVQRSTVSNLKPLTVGALLPLIVLSVFDEDYRKNVLPVQVTGLAQLFYWQLLQVNKYNDKNKFSDYTNYGNKKWRLVVDFSTLDLDRIGAEERKDTSTSTREGLRTIKTSGPGNYTISIGLDRLFKPDFSAGLSITYFPAGTMKIDIVDTTRYGTSTLRTTQKYKAAQQFGVINFDLNWKVISILSQKIYLSLGAYWGNTVEYNKTLYIRKYITIDVYDTVNFKYKLQPYGFTAGILIDSPLNSNYSFDFRMRMYAPITTNVNKDAILHFLPTWHAGLAYKF